MERNLHQSRIVLSDGVRRFTFLQIHQKAMEYSAFFQKKGAIKGDRILVVEHDPIEMVLLLLACIARGYVFVPVSNRMAQTSREEIIRDCKPRFIINDGFNEAPKDLNYSEERPLCDEDTLVYLIYTSGTEGTPKGVIAKQKQILFCADAINQRLKHRKDDRILCCLPLSFDYGMYQIFLAFLSGAVLFLDDGSVMQRIPFLIKQWRITEFPTIPTVANLLLRGKMLNRNVSCTLRRITFTGETLSLALINQLKEELPKVQIVPMYGLTECKRVAVMPSGHDDKVMSGSCGLPLDGVVVTLENQDLQTGIGELTVEGDNVMEGYWGITDQESHVFSVNQRTGKRMVRTGDLFSIDVDGFLYFQGRKSGILKIRGYRVSTPWLENLFYQIPEVLEVAVIGMSDVLTGERAVVFVVTASEVTKEIVMNAIKHLPLPDFLLDSKLYFMESPLPKNRNGKIDRMALQKIAEERTGQKAFHRLQ